MPKFSIKPAVTLLAAIALCTALGGCVSDIGSSMPGLTQSTNDSPTMRYYGGPKYPMWPSNQ